MSAQDEAYQFATDLWRFYRTFAFSGSARDDLFWQEVVKKANALYAKYGSSKARHMLILDVIDALEEKTDGKRQTV